MKNKLLISIFCIAGIQAAYADSWTINSPDATIRISPESIKLVNKEKYTLYVSTYQTPKKPSNEHNKLFQMYYVNCSENKMRESDRTWYDINGKKVWENYKVPTKLQFIPPNSTRFESKILSKVCNVAYQM